MTDQNRRQFREQVFDRDDNTCIVPWCDSNAADAHHIIERALWDAGGYIPDNGASVCNGHHQYAETNDIPPQAFWMWAGIEDPPLPSSVDTWQVNKWGDEFDTPPWEEHRDYIKYQSSRHMLPLYWNNDSTEEEHVDDDDTGLESLDEFVGVPLVITHKMDGGNCQILNDVENPVRARRGSGPEKSGTMRRMYRDGGLYWQQAVNEKLPDRLSVFGEWLWAKHSIHYGCDCEEPCDDVGPALSELVDVDDDRAYFQVFGVYDQQLNMWLSWPETEQVAETLGFPTVPVIHCEDDRDTATFETEHEAKRKLRDYAQNVVNEGGEGIVVRKKFPYHYGQFGRSLGKYVRANHVEDGADHWRSEEVLPNRL